MNNSPLEGWQAVPDGVEMGKVPAYNYIKEPY